MAHKKNITMDSEKALLYAVARALGPYIAQIPGAFDTTAPVVHDVATLSRPEFKVWKYRYAYRRCGEFGEPDNWVRDGETGLAYCANGSEPYPMADEQMTRVFLEVVCGVVRAAYLRVRASGSESVIDYPYWHGGGVLEVRGFGVFSIRRKYRARWKNVKNGKYYRADRDSIKLYLRPLSRQTWVHGDG